MFYYDVTMSKKVTIKKRDNDSTIITVQNNEKGVFWPSEDIELSKQETSELSFDDIMSLIFTDTVPKNKPMFLPSYSYIMENKQKFIIALVAWVIILSFSILFMLPRSAWETITTQSLESDITAIRKNREIKYDKCVNVCDAERSVFDSQIIYKKKMIEKMK